MSADSWQVREDQMDKKYVSVRFGNGSKTHVGVETTIAGRYHMFTFCGSRKSGTAKRVMGDLDLTTFIAEAGSCDKCTDHVEKLLAKVGA
jgi:hypothetical protein